MALQTKTVLEHFRRDFRAADEGLRDALDKRELRREDFGEFGELFAECFGYEEYHAVRSGRRDVADVFEANGPRKLTRVAEDQGAVTTAAFLNISGNILYSAFLDRYRAEEFVFTRLITEQKGINLDGERMAGVTDIGNAMQVRDEGDPYALAGPSENWVFTPPIRDRGVIVPLTWEAVFQDRTGQLIDRASNLGYSAGIDKENRAIDAVIDENTTAHRYNWRNAGQIQTFNNNTGSHTWDNLQASNELVDHTDINAAELLFNGMTDPFTGEPVVFEPRHIIAVSALSLTVARILNSTQILTHIGGFATSGNLPAFTQANPYLGKYQPVTSRRLATRLATDTDWFLGDVTAAVVYIWAEKMNIVQAPAGNVDDFNRRIVQQFRVNERGQHYVREPRALVKSTVA